jgi:hypothetical protein
MHDVAEQLERRALVMVLSDFFGAAEQIRGGLAHLRHERHEVIALQIVDRDEEEFPFRNWSRFRGLEGEPARLCEPALARKTYLESFRVHRRLLQEACLALRVEWQLFITDRPVLEALRTFLSRRTTTVRR